MRVAAFRYFSGRSSFGLNSRGPARSLTCSMSIYNHLRLRPAYRLTRLCSGFKYAAEQVSGMTDRPTPCRRPADRPPASDLDCLPETRADSPSKSPTDRRAVPRVPTEPPQQLRQPTAAFGWTERGRPVACSSVAPWPLSVATTSVGYAAERPRPGGGFLDPLRRRLSVSRRSVDSRGVRN